MNGNAIFFDLFSTVLHTVKEETSRVSELVFRSASEGRMAES